GLLSDTLRHLLATDAGERRAGLAGIAGRMFGVEPVRVRHRSMGEALPFEVVHYPKTSGRAFAVTMTLGLGEDLGAERIAATLADARDPHAGDRRARPRRALDAVGGGAPSPGLPSPLGGP